MYDSMVNVSNLYLVECREIKFMGLYLPILYCYALTITVGNLLDNKQLDLLPIKSRVHQGSTIHEVIRQTCNLAGNVQRFKATPNDAVRLLRAVYTWRCCTF